MRLVPIYTPGWRETKWSKVPCLSRWARIEPQTSRSEVWGVNCSVTCLHFLWKKPGAMFIVARGNPLVTALSQNGKPRRRISQNLQISMQCWWRRLLHPSSQLIKLSPSTISNKHIGHVSSSSRWCDDKPSILAVPGAGDGTFSCPFDLEFFKSLASFVRRDSMWAWYLDRSFSTLWKVY